MAKNTTKTEETKVTTEEQVIEDAVVNDIPEEEPTVDETTEAPEEPKKVGLIGTVVGAQVDEFKAGPVKYIGKQVWRGVKLYLIIRGGKEVIKTIADKRALTEVADGVTDVAVEAITDAITE